MQKRKLGRSGLEIAPLMLGGNVFGWTADERASHAVLDRVADAGLDAIDTADVYSRWAAGHSGGESEAVIGRWLAGRGGRDRIVIATKVGWEMGPQAKGLSRAYIMKSVEGSLRRLQTDYIDLYQSHIDDAATPFEETLSAYEDLMRQGKVRAVGCSNITADRLRAALEVSRSAGLPRYESVQPHYNLYVRSDFERELARLCVGEGIGAIPYYALASGFLTGKYRGDGNGDSPRAERAAAYLDERGRRVLDVLDAVAAEHEVPVAAVAIAWLLTKPGVESPIASARTPEQLADVLPGVSLTLSADQLSRLDEASAS